MFRLKKFGSPQSQLHGNIYPKEMEVAVFLAIVMGLMKRHNINGIYIRRNLV